MPTVMVIARGATAAQLAARSRAWRTRAMDGDEELLVGVPTDEALIGGAFQRRSEMGEGRLLRRGSGGGPALVGPGTVWMQLLFAHAAMPDKLLNRQVRPLLKALTRVANAPVSYFGRDWLSARQKPVAMVAFAHEARTGRALFEAIIGATSTFALSGARPSFLGKTPAPLGVPAETIVRALMASDAREVPLEDVGEKEDTSWDDPPWSATVDEAIGVIGAGPDRNGALRIGGELMASCDAIERLEREVSSRCDLDRAVDEAFTTEGAVIFGVRSLASIRDVILRTSPARPSSTG